MQGFPPIRVAAPSGLVSPPGMGLGSGPACPVMIARPVERLSRDHRLRLARDYARVKAAGASIRGRHCLLLALACPGEATRIGFIASKKGVGGAVQRNRARRRLREIVRRRWSRVPKTGYWLAFVAFRSALAATHQELATDLERLLAEAGALSPLGIQER